ncbi:MAG: AP2 domain-containing protein [Phycisphaerae bacterium]|nr:AP2 domain-containing protein [Phycisphaerae bacterium]
MRLCIVILLAYRKRRFGYPFRKIELTKGKFTIVDPENFDYLNQFKWQATKGKYTFYACRMITVNGRPRHCSMHRVIMDAPDGMVVDHKNRDGLDNRKANLRIATLAQNNYNSLKGFFEGSSKYRGVSFDKKTNKWRATIYFENKRIHLGMFETEKEAAEAYDRAAGKYHGEFALRNCDIFKSDNLPK